MESPPARDLNLFEDRIKLNKILSAQCSLKLEHIHRGIENKIERLNVRHYENLKDAYEAENVLIQHILDSQGEDTLC